MIINEGYLVPNSMTYNLIKNELKQKKILFFFPNGILNEFFRSAYQTKPLYLIHLNNNFDNRILQPSLFLDAKYNQETVWKNFIY